MAPVKRSSPSPQKPTTLHHANHPMHPLLLLDLVHEFLCDACGTEGSGPRYRCNACDFDLHEFCATCPIFTKSPYHPGHTLALSNLPQPVDKDRCCHICGYQVHLLFYRCIESDRFDVHPLCTLLPPHVELPQHPQHFLKLQPAAPVGCLRCFKVCTSLRYRCEACNLDIHPECALIGTAAYQMEGGLVGGDEEGDEEAEDTGGIRKRDIIATTIAKFGTSIVLESLGIPSFF